MSSRVSTHTMFIDKECLLEALDIIGCKYRLEDERIITDRKDYYGDEIFAPRNGKYVFIHDSAAMNYHGQYGPAYPWNNNNLPVWLDVGTFLQKVDAAYQKSYSAKLEKMAEEERRREEERKRQMVEAKKKQIIENAKAKGYHVKESREGNTIQLVLVRTVMRCQKHGSMWPTLKRTA